MNQRKAWILLTLCTFFWAGNYVFGQFVLGELTPLVLTFLRWFFATILLLIIAWHMEKPNWREVIKSWPMLLVMAVSGIVAYNMILYTALTYTSSVNASVVSALNPVLLVVFSALLLREKLSMIQATGILVSFSGVLVIITEGHISRLMQLQVNPGDLLMLAAITVWTVYSIVAKRLTKVPPITATALSALMATLILAPFALYQGISFDHVSGLALVGVLYIVLFPSVGSFIFWNLGVREIGAGKAGIFLNLIPVFTALISLMLGKAVTLVQITGGLLVFLGVYATTGMLENRLKTM